MASLSDLIKVPTKDELVSRFVGFLRLANFPALSWQTLSFPRFTVESESSLLSELAATISEVAKGGFTKTAKGPWLDLVAENFFADARKPSTHAVGEVLLTDAASVGPVTITPGQKWFSNASKTLRYVVESVPYGSSVPLNGSLRVVVRAEFAGATYNVGVGAITEFVTSTPGLSVSNPAIGDTGTWLTAQGVDVELDEALASRLLDKWALRGTGSNDAAYRYYALSSGPEVTRVRVWSPGGGAVRIVVAGPSAPVSAPALALASALIQSKRPLGVPDTTTANATSLSVSIAGTLYLKKGSDGAARVAEAQSAVAAYARVHPIGAMLSRERVIRDLFVEGASDLNLTSPAADTALGDTQIFVPSFSLTTVVES